MNDRIVKCMVCLAVQWRGSDRRLWWRWPWIPQHYYQVCSIFSATIK